MMSTIEAVIFDLGSTLIYFDGDWSQVYGQAAVELSHFLKQAGFKLDEDKFLQEFRSRLEQYHTERESEYVEYTTGYILRTLLNDWGYSDISDDVIKSALEAMYSISQAHWKPEEDAIPTLEKLKEQGHRLALISNAADDADVQALVDKANLRPYFELVLSSAAIGIRKPHPHIFEIVLEALKTTPNRAAMVGDTLDADILGAQHLGMYGIWITRRANLKSNQVRTSGITPDAVIGRLSELPGLLEELVGN